MRDLHLGAAKTRVALHDGFCAVVEADLIGLFEPVRKELGAVCLLDLHALSLATKLVLLEHVVLRSPRSRDVGLVGS